MKHATTKKHRYVEWISPEEMHLEALSWISELMFARDEQQFLNDMVKTYTLQLTDKNIFDESRKIVSGIADAEHRLTALLKLVQAHENQLEIMVDDLDQPKMEKAYKESHRDLISQIDEYLTDYRKLKKQLFGMLTKVMKKEKQKRLLN